MEFHEFAGVVLVDSPGLGGVTRKVVEVVEHRRVLRAGEEHRRELPECVGSHHRLVGAVLEERHPGLLAPRVEVVRPEVAHDFVQLAVGVDGTLDRRVVQLLDDPIPSAVGVLDVVVLPVGVGERGVPGHPLLGVRDVAPGGIELVVDPAPHAAGLDRCRETGPRPERELVDGDPHRDTLATGRRHGRRQGRRGGRWRTGGVRSGRGRRRCGGRRATTTVRRSARRCGERDAGRCENGPPRGRAVVEPCWWCCFRCGRGDGRGHARSIGAEHPRT